MKSLRELYGPLATPQLELREPQRELAPLLCRLRSGGRPPTTQHPVPAGGPPLPGGVGYPLGPTKSFHRYDPLTASSLANLSWRTLRLSHRRRDGPRPRIRECPRRRGSVGFRHCRRVRLGHRLGIGLRCRRRERLRHRWRVRLCDRRCGWKRDGRRLRPSPSIGRIDPASSGRWFPGWRKGAPPPPDPPAVAAPRSWLLSVGWRRRGLIDSAEVPGPGRAPSSTPLERHAHAVFQLPARAPSLACG